MKMLRVFILLSIYALCACSIETAAVVLTEAHALDVEVISTVTKTYCKLPHHLRELNRQRWNAMIAPNRITLECYGDA